MRIPIMTNAISPMAYLSYIPAFPSESKLCLIFLKNLIIDYSLVKNEAQRIVGAMAGCFSTKLYSEN